MKRIFPFILLFVPCIIHAQDIQESLSLDSTTYTVQADTLPADILQRLLTHLSETQEAALAPVHRAISAATPLLDSIVYTDQNGHITHQESYEYDATDRLFRTKTEYFNADGSHTNASTISENAYNGNTQVMTAAYTWGNGQWEGTSRLEYVYNDANKRITQINYAWRPTHSFWTPSSSTTYTYDELYRIPEQTTYSIDNTTFQLVGKTRTTQAWDANKNLILKEYLTGGIVNDAWQGGSGSTKNIYAYQTYGTANKKILDEAYTWNTSTKTWAGKASGKTTWDYTADGSKETDKVVFNWNATTLQYDSATATYKEYNASNLETSSFAYKWTNGVKAGNGTGTRKVYSGNNIDSTFSYTWRNGGWECTKIVVKLVNAANKAIVNETRNYNTSGVGSGSGTYTYYAPNNTTQIAQTTYTFAQSTWTPKDSVAYQYNGNTLVSTDQYKWDASIPAWVGTTKTVPLTGLNIVSGSLTYTYSNGEWTLISGTKNVSFTDSDGAFGTISYSCNSTATWVITSGSKTHTYTDTDNATLTLIWSLSSDSVWTFKSGTKIPADLKNDQNKTILQRSYYSGSDSLWHITSYKEWAYDDAGRATYYATFKKDSVPEYYTNTTYDENGKKLLETRYDWSNNTWIGNYQYEYAYNAAGNTILSIHLSSWYNNTWRAGTKDTYTYDASGRVIERANYVWNNSDWSPTSKYISTYDTNGNLIVFITQVNSSGVFINSTKSEKEYIGTTVSKETLYTWKNNTWILSSINQTATDPETSEEMTLTDTYEDGILVQHDETTYLQGSTLVSTIESATYNADGTIATYELATYHYSTD